MSDAPDTPLRARVREAAESIRAELNLTDDELQDVVERMAKQLQDIVEKVARREMRELTAADRESVLPMNVAQTDVFVSGVAFDDDARPVRLTVCRRRLPELDDTRAFVPEEELSMLRQAVERYLDNPGCNANSRRTAMARLRHAARLEGGS